MIINKLKKYNFSLISLYAFLIPFNQKVSTVMLILLIITKLCKWKELKFKTSLKLLLPAFIYVFLILSLLYSEEYDSKYFIRKLQLLVFPLLFSFSNEKFNSKKIEVILKSFVIGCVLSVLTCEVYSFYRAWTFYPGGFYAIVQPGHDLFQSMSEGGNLFFGKYFSVFHQTAYYAIMLLFSLTILILKPFSNKKVHYSTLLIVILGLFQISNRASFIVLGVLLLAFFIKKWRVVTIKRKAIGGLLLILLSTLILTNPRFNSMILSVLRTGVEVNPNATNTYQVRVLTWDASLKLISKNFLLGVGIAEHKHELMEEYAKHKYVEPLDSQLNSHNQYLTITIQIGVIGFILIILMLYFLLKENDLMYSDMTKGLAIILFITFLFESMLERYSGLMFFSFFYCLLINKQGLKEA